MVYLVYLVIICNSRLHSLQDVLTVPSNSSHFKISCTLAPTVSSLDDFNQGLNKIKRSIGKRSEYRTFNYIIYW